MRIAVGGIMHESNTFAAAVTDRRKFEQGSLTFGDDLIPVWKDAHHEMGGFLEGAGRFGFQAVSTVMAWATPAGPVDDAVLDEVVSQIMERTMAGGAEALLVALHGAMVTARHASADGEVLRRLRAGVGAKFPIVASLDFHGNVSAAMAEHADALVGYQTYPHVDQRSRGLVAAEIAARAARGEIRPVTAIAKPAMIINLLGQDTARPPMTTLMAAARAAERRCGVLSVSVMAGFPYADVPDMGPTVIAVADGDRRLAQSVADEIAAEMWEVRRDLFVPTPTPAQAVAEAIRADRRPVLLIDLGDNIGGGSAGDGTVLLAELIRQGFRGAIVPLYSPESAAAAQAAGAGGAFDCAVGGAIDRLHGEPIRVRGKVRSLHDGKWVETEARHGGRRHNDQGPTAVIDLEGGNVLVVNSLRTPPFSLGQLTSLGLDPTKAVAIVVKAAVAYKAAYLPIAGRVIEVDTPGITAINPARFEYKRRRRPMFPLEG
jgi:microcystin degradation protein MlrC